MIKTFTAEFMFALETQLHESVNGVIFGLAKHFAAAGYFPSGI